MQSDDKEVATFWLIQHGKIVSTITGPRKWAEDEAAYYVKLNKSPDFTYKEKDTS